jgi:hypothetical protein
MVFMTSSDGTEQAFLAVGKIKRTTKSKWKVLHSKTLNIEKFISVIAKDSADKAASEIKWTTKERKRNLIIEEAVRSIMHREIEFIILSQEKELNR